jgi:hypothetical protein
LQKQARKQIAAVAIGLFRSSLKGPNLFCYQLVAANLPRENQKGKGTVVHILVVKEFGGEGAA